MTTTQAAAKRQKRIEELDAAIEAYRARGIMLGATEVMRLNTERRHLREEIRAEEEAARRDARTTKEIVDEAMGRNW